MILRYLYERRDDSQQYSIATILEELGIENNATEVARLADLLSKDKYIHLNDLSSKLKKARITAKGITYCEGSSYAHKGQSVVNHYHIVNSPQANIVVNSSQVEINQKQQDKAQEIINEMREAISRDQVVEIELKKDILECLTEIEAGIANKKTPRFAIKSLLGMGSDIASISGFVLNLAQLFGALPA